MTRLNHGAFPLLAVASLSLTACMPAGFDLDLRDRLNVFDTSPAVTGTVSARPDADGRGVITYPDYQVAVARRDDTVGSIASRLGIGAQELADYNGLPTNAALRRGEIVVLPRRIDPPSAPVTATPAASATPLPAAQPVQTTSLEARADAAIDRVETPAPTPTPEPTRTAAVAPPKAALPEGTQPIRHKVQSGETAFSIARKYGISAQALAKYNGLDEQMTVRRDAVLLVPAVAKPPAADTSESRPGEGTRAPAPPSAAKPLPEERATQAPPKETPASPAMSQETTKASTSGGRLGYPVQGRVVRAYAKGKNEGIDIAASAGTAVRAAGDGTVAAITRDTDQIPILVLRHPGNLLTVYAGLTDIAVSKGDTVKRGQTVAKVRSGDPAALHFEVREGFESVDPASYLD